MGDIVTVPVVSVSAVGYPGYDTHWVLEEDEKSVGC